MLFGDEAVEVPLIILPHTTTTPTPSVPLISIMRFTCIYLIVCTLWVSSCSKNVKIAVALTSIPPRFPFLHLSLPYWLNQEIPVDRVCLFIPYRYKRFHRKGSKVTNEDNMLDYVHQHLQEHDQTSAMLESKLLKTISMDRDWGPITRFVGYVKELTTESYQNCYSPQEEKPNFWLVADDDVGYQPNSLSKYIQHLLNHDAIDSKKRIVLTNFSRDYRLFFKVSERDEDMHIPQHIQGVDTYLLPHLLPGSHPSSTLSMTLKTLEFFHKTCPETFYQDDYLVSFWLYLFDYEVISMWSNDNLAIHIPGVSTEHNQMHMHPKVFEREERTKSCLYTYAKDVYAWISGNNDSILVNVTS